MCTNVGLYRKHHHANDFHQRVRTYPYQQKFGWFSVTTLTFKAKYCQTPLYLHEQLRDHQVARTLRSTTAPLFYRPFVCPLSSPLGHSTTLHLKFGTVSGHPQDRRTLSVVLGVAQSLNCSPLHMTRRLAITRQQRF